MFIDIYQEKVKIQKATWVYLLLATEQVILINIINTFFFFNLFSRSLNTVIIFQEDPTSQTAGTWQNHLTSKCSST